MYYLCSTFYRLAEGLVPIDVVRHGAAFKFCVRFSDDADFHTFVGWCREYGIPFRVDLDDYDWLVVDDSNCLTCG